MIALSRDYASSCVLLSHYVYTRCAYASRRWEDRKARREGRKTGRTAKSKRNERKKGGRNVTNGGRLIKFTSTFVLFTKLRVSLLLAIAVPRLSTTTTTVYYYYYFFYDTTTVLLIVLLQSTTITTDYHHCQHSRIYDDLLKYYIVKYK